jgi:hypothetical protein
MADTHLQTREQYEERYDGITVEVCRLREQAVYEVLGEPPTMNPKVAATSSEEMWGYYRYSMFYFELVESLAGERWQERDTTIREWMKKDEEKDRHLAEAKPSTTPYCRSCGEDMEIKLKTFASRERGGAKKDKDDVLFMFRCVPCNTRMALWQDGSEWKGYQPHCEKCNAPVDETDTVKDNVITSTYTCSNCGHDYKNVWVLGTEPETPSDPHYKLDMRRFCFDGTTGKKFLARKAHIADLTKQLENGRGGIGGGPQAVDNIAVAVNAIETLKVAQLADLLAKAVAGSGYIEFKLGEPQNGRELVVPFSCLDNQPKRESYDSRMGLKKLIASTLSDTNWRLMSDGVSYRLGYLRGRLRAYENDEELHKLVENHPKGSTRKKPTATPTPEPPTPAEPTAPARKNSRRGKQRAIRVRGVLHPNLHILIPPRETQQPPPKANKSK